VLAGPESGAMKAIWIICTNPAVSMPNLSRVERALKSARGNMASAARALKTTQRIFGYKVHRHQIDAKKYSG